MSNSKKIKFVVSDKFLAWLCRSAARDSPTCSQIDIKVCILP